MDHLPPPPYSETDIYSNAPASPINLTPATSQTDNRSLPTPSAASSVDDSVIFTPPYTPNGSLHQNLGDHVSSVSAAAYFDTRPAHALPTSPPVVHSITITSVTEPKDLSYPEPIEDFKAKDITEQDWATFVNYLLPDYTAIINNDVADRKIRAEMLDGEMQKLSLGQGDRSRTNINQVDAQLEPLRQPASPQHADRMGRAEETIAEWNEGFFMPRGVKISLFESERTADDDMMKMPGAWIPYDHELVDGSSCPSNRMQRRGWSFGGIRADSRGFRMGPIVADNDGFRIGKSLVADGNGFRMGSLVADNSGFRLGGAFVADGHGLTVGGRSWGRRESHDREAGCGRGRGRHAHRRGRGRSHSHGKSGKGRGRSSSTSSSSSSSRTSYSDSGSSVGSLPEYDDLKDHQLPMAKQSLVDWLNHPEQPITKETIRNIKQEFKVAKRTTSQRQFDQDIKALRKEVKGLMKQFRETKKTQRAVKRELKRERRAVKRGVRRERRLARREARQAWTSERKGKHEDDYRQSSPWTASKHHAAPTAAETASAATMPRGINPTNYSSNTAYTTRDGFPSGIGFPTGRGFGSASGGGFGGFPFGRTASGPPGMSAMHGGWPFTQGMAYAPGRISVPNLNIGGFPEPIAQGAESIHEQAVQMDREAAQKEKTAINIRTAATSRRVSKKENLEKMNEANALEEEAEKYRREAERLRAEALHLDSELARELDQENGLQASGVISV